MADNVKPRVKVPKSADAGEVITIKTLISHPMESGVRKDADGNLIPRSIINRFTCEVNGNLVIDVTMEPAISTNPYFEFDAKIEEAGDIVFTWYDDDGSVYTTSAPIANPLIRGSVGMSSSATAHLSAVARHQGPTPRPAAPRVAAPCSSKRFARSRVRSHQASDLARSSTNTGSSPRALPTSRTALRAL